MMKNQVFKMTTANKNSQTIPVERKVILLDPKLAELYDSYKRPIEKDRKLKKEVLDRFTRIWQGSKQKKSEIEAAKEEVLAELYERKLWPYTPEEKQIKILESEESLLNAFCNLGDVGGLHFYPELTTPAAINLENRIINALRTMPPKNELSKHGSKNLIKLNWDDDQFIISDSSFRSKSELRLNITRLNEVGSTIIAIEDLKSSYTYNNISMAAPPDANAYWRAFSKKLIVRGPDSKYPEGIPKMDGMSSMWSLVCGDTRLFTPGIPEEEYIITPVKYFRIETENPVKRMRKELKNLKTKYILEQKGIKSFYENLKK